MEPENEQGESEETRQGQVISEEEQVALDRRESRRMMMKAADASFIGIEFGVGVALGFFAGRWLDKTYGWAPWGTTILVLLGLSVAVRDLIRLANKVRKEES